MKRWLALVLVVLSAGCVDRGAGPQGKKIDPKYIRENLFDAAKLDIRELGGGPIHAVGVNLGGKVIYLGNKVVYLDGKSPTTPLAPGASIRVVHYWQVMEPPGDGWRVFSFARGAQGSADFMSFQPTDMQIGHPVRKWKAGQVIQDPQDIVLRPDWRSSTMTLYVGLVAAGKHQLGDRMAASGPNVVDRAVIARTLEIDLSRAPPPLGTVYVPHATGPITIDGMAIEAGWSSAVTSAELVVADGSGEPVGKATARMSWDEQNLYVFVSIVDTDVYSPYKQHDEPLWKADCVELFIDADGNRSGYVELQVNPNNATFDSYFETTRAKPGDEKWDAGMVTAVRVRGNAAQSGDADQGWDVEIAIPHAAVKGRHESMAVKIPPQVGDRWRLNLVRVDYRSGGGNPNVASWNRISISDFHALDRMLTAVFADATGSIIAKPEPPAGAPSETGSAAAPAEKGSAPAPASGSTTRAPATGSAAPAGSAGSAGPAMIVPAERVIQRQ